MKKVSTVATKPSKKISPQKLTVMATTDREGIYDIAGLPPGKYQVRLPTNSGQESPIALTNFPTDLEAGQVAEYSFSFRRAALRSK